MNRSNACRLEAASLLTDRLVYHEKQLWTMKSMLRS